MISTITVLRICSFRVSCNDFETDETVLFMRGTKREMAFDWLFLTPMYVRSRQKKTDRHICMTEDVNNLLPNSIPIDFHSDRNRLEWEWNIMLFCCVMFHSIQNFCAISHHKKILNEETSGIRMWIWWLECHVSGNMMCRYTRQYMMVLS